MSAKPHLLLHVCCGPCATAVIERLLSRYHVTAFWHNPNIHPQQEHDRRLEQAHIVAREFDLDLIVDDCDQAAWLTTVSGYEDEPEGGRRCPLCFDQRLRRTGEEAVRRNIGIIATTLSVSPHKSLAQINQVGERVARDLGVQFLGGNFRAEGGFERSLELSKHLGLYRQRYCGCRFSQR